MSRFSSLPSDQGLDGSDEIEVKDREVKFNTPRNRKYHKEKKSVDDEIYSSDEVFVKLWTVYKTKEEHYLACTFHPEVTGNLTKWYQSNRSAAFGFIMYTKDLINKSKVVEMCKSGQLVFLGKYEYKLLCRVFDWVDSEEMRPLKRMNHFEIIHELKILDILEQYGLSLE